MTTPGYVESWPWPFHPVDANPGDPAVQVFQLRPDLVTEFVNWCGGTLLMVNNGPAVLLPGHAPAARRIAGLGDFGVQLVGGTTWHAEPAAGFYQRFTPDPPPDPPSPPDPPNPPDPPEAT